MTSPSIQVRVSFEPSGPCPAHFGFVPAWGEAPLVRRILIAEIQYRVARYYDLPVIEMKSSRRSHSVAHPRQVAMYLARHLTLRSLPEIGRRFGGRDHTTLIHAIKPSARRRAEGPDLDADIRAIEAELGA